MMERIRQQVFTGTLRCAAALMAAGALLASCAKEYDGPDSPSAERELCFSVSQQGEKDHAWTATRATPVEENEFHRSFGVFGYTYLSKQGWNETVTPDYMYDVEFTDDGAGTYASAETYFLPGKGTDIRFFAYAPYEAEGLTLPKQGEGGAPVYGYTVPKDVSEQSDLCFAGPDPIAGGTETVTVELPFVHALTAVSFVEGSKMVPGTITGISLKGLYGSAEYNTGSTGTNKWTDFSTPNSTFSQMLNVSVPSSEGKAITSEEQTFMLLPQDLTNAKLEVAFTNKLGEAHTLTAPLGNGTWQSGEHVTYTIRITGDRLEIESVNVTKWNEHKVINKDSEPAYLPERLKIGDYFYSDGTWSDGGLRWIKEDGEHIIADPKPAPVKDKTVVGIVYATFMDHPHRFGKMERETILGQYGHEPRGLVMSIKNAETDVMWAKDRKNEELKDLAKQADLYNDISGMANCHLMKEEYGSFDKFPAFKAAEDYNTTCPVPNTTGWYLPAVGQWWDILQYLSCVPALASSYNQTDTEKDVDFNGNFMYRNAGNASDKGSVTNSLDYLNAWMSKIPDTDKDDFPYPEYHSDNKNKHTSYYFWSSSEQGYTYAWACQIVRENYREGFGYINLSQTVKEKDKYDVRPVLAF